MSGFHPTVIPITTCPRCLHTETNAWTPCGVCHGLKRATVRRGQILHIKKSFTLFAVKLVRARVWLDRFEMIGAAVFAFGFFSLFALQVAALPAFETIFSSYFWVQNSRATPLWFWLGAVAVSFLIYKLLSRHHEPDTVEQRSYGMSADDRKETTDVTPENIVSLVGMKGLKRKDIYATFTSEAKTVIDESFLVAEKYGVREVGPVQLFLALLSTSAIVGIFVRLGIAPSRVRALVGPLMNKEATPNVPAPSVEFVQILFQAYEAAVEGHQEFVAPTELLLATIGQSPELQEVLYTLGVDDDTLANVVAWVRVREQLRREYSRLRRAGARRSNYGMDRAMTAVATPYLNNFSQDITLAAKFGYLPACVARDNELEDIFRIIDSGRQSILLVGDHGVGKMSIIEGIAQRMVSDRVPKRLHDKRLVQLSTSALLAGTTTAGAEERLIRMVNEIRRAKNIILFINNLDDLMGAGGTGLDVAGTLAEHMSDSGMLVFATTTTDGYNRQIARTQLGTAFARVDIKEMDDNQVIQVLESRVGSVEYKTGVFFSYQALADTVKLARRFLHETLLPEAGIELMTEAAAYVQNKKGKDSLVTSEDVATVASKKTGIPAASISGDEASKLLLLEEAMHTRVIGQDEAVTLVASALRRARAEIRSAKKPIASFLFLGPTGVGKTELAKTIAEVYFGGEERMVRFDMSEYQDTRGIYRLIGEPNKQGTGQLTEAVRQQPFSLVLLDEIEKAHPDILNLFLQVFDDGRLTDSVGRVVDFTNTIIISTSNAGTEYVQAQLRAGAAPETIRQQLLRSELKKYYRPEFLNRFDGIVLFRSLDRTAIKRVAALMLERVGKDLENRGVSLRVEDAALDSLADIGFDADFGARPMRRAIQDTVENALADLILKGQLQRRDVVVLDGNGVHVERGGARQ